jgi:thiol-disulfide isomerase/thioredoxin
MSRNFCLSMAAAVAVVLYFIAPGSQAQTGEHERFAGAAAPEWQLEDPDGQPLKLSDFKGKVVILDFWATWCEPCRWEISVFVALQKQYAAQGLTVVGVSMDDAGASVVKSFMKNLGMNYPVVIGTERVADLYGGISGLPTTFIIDRNGNIVTSREGIVSQETLEREIRPLLK